MYRQSINPFYTRAFANSIVNAFGARPAAALAAALELHLWKDPAFNPTQDTPAADFVTAEANFTGYAAVTGVALTSPVNLSLQAVGAIGSGVFTLAAPGTVTNSVYGYWLLSGTTVVAYEKFANGQEANLGTVGDFLDLLAALPIDFSQVA